MKNFIKENIFISNILFWIFMVGITFSIRGLILIFSLRLFQKINFKYIFEYFWKKRKYYIPLILSSIYVWINWEKCEQFQFFEKFSGNNLIFITWLVLLIAPNIKEIKGVILEHGETASVSEKYISTLMNDKIKSENLPKESEIENIKQKLEKELKNS